MSAHGATITIVADSPQEAGARLMHEAVLPLLYRVNDDMPADQRPMLWASTMAALAGGMAASLDAKAAAAIMKSIEPMLALLSESAQAGSPH